MRRFNCIGGDIPDTEGNVALILFVSNSKGMKGFDQDDGRRADGLKRGEDEQNLIALNVLWSETEG